MSTKVEYVDSVSTISTLQMDEPCLNIYHPRKLKEIINTRITMMPFIQSQNLGWTGMFMRLAIDSLSEPNPWQDPANLGVVIPDIGNPMDTVTEHKHHQTYRF